MSKAEHYSLYISILQDTDVKIEVKPSVVEISWWDGEKQARIDIDMEIAKRILKNVKKTQIEDDYCCNHWGYAMRHNWKKTHQDYHYCPFCGTKLNEKIS